MQMMMKTNIIISMFYSIQILDVKWFLRYGVCSCPSPLVVQGNVCVEKEDQVVIIDSIAVSPYSQMVSDGKVQNTRILRQ